MLENTIDLIAVLESPSEEFLPRAFREVIGREPDMGGLLHYIERLKKGLPRELVLAEMRHSAEGQERSFIARSTELDALHTRYLKLRDLPLGKLRWKRLPRLSKRNHGDARFDWTNWINTFIDSQVDLRGIRPYEVRKYGSATENKLSNFDHKFQEEFRTRGYASHLTSKASEKRSNLFEWLKKHELPLSFMPLDQLPEEILRVNRATGLQINLDDLLDVFQGNAKYPVYFYENTEKNSRHYVYMARYFLSRSLKQEGRNLLKASLMFYPLSSAYELLANTFLDEKLYDTSLSYYKLAYEMPNPSKWVYINMANCLINLGEHLKSVELLSEAIKNYPQCQMLRSELDKITKLSWDLTYSQLIVFAQQNQRERLIEAATNYSISIYESYLSAFGVKSHSDTLHDINQERVLIIGDFHVPQCVRYRIDQKKEQLRSTGKIVKTVDWTKLDEDFNEVAKHDIVIFYRVPATPSVIKAMAQVNATGKLSIYEIDDLIFESIYPPPIESYGGYVTFDLYYELTRGMGLFNAAARLCRLGIASTEPLRERLARLVFSGDCILHRNGLDHLNENRERHRGLKHNIDIFYGSGTQAHNSDFIELALPAIGKLLERNARVRLVVVGYLKMPDPFIEKYGSQIKQLPPVKSVQGYWSLMEQADINIAVLHHDTINDCKSELKWFEAACYGLPSVVSYTANYRDVIKHGKDGFIAKTGDQWFEILKELVENPRERERIGKAALDRVRNEYSVETLGNSLVQKLGKSISLYSSAKGARQKKCKVALVNVFFPPQSIGGATRVVADNFKMFKARYEDEINLCVFTADAEFSMPHQLSVYNMEGSRVYRVTTVWREHMDWHFKDPELYNIFREFLALEQPDIIHFHCVQRLTASVVEAARDAAIPYLITAHDAWWISDFQFLVDHKGKVYPNGHSDPFDPVELPPGITVEESIERKHVLRRLLHDAKEVLTVSNSFAEIYRLNGIDNVHVVPNGISDDQPWAPKETSYTEKVVCGHIGGMSGHKGYYLLQEAVRDVQPENLEFLVVDHSKDEGFESMEYWGRVPVRFIGRVSQEAIVELYRKLDILFAPSIWPESFGLVTREAAACGCWVVASNMGGIGEDITDEVTGYIIEPTKNDLARIIRMINKKPLQFKEIITKSESRFASVQADILVKEYKSLTGY